MNRRLFSIAACAVGAGMAIPTTLMAQSWPPGRVNIIVPFPAGATTDITARVIAERLAQIWGQPVTIDNKGGGNGLPAAESAARARPDGLTLFMTSAMTHAINPWLYDKLPYNPIEDFEPVTLIAKLSFVVLVPADSPLKTLTDLTDLLKREPGRHNFGAGSLPARMASELYRQLVGVDVQHIGYKSNPQAFPDLLSGRLTFMTIDLTNGGLQIEGGKMRGLAITTAQRDAKLSQVPTAIEAGLPDFQIWTWTGIYAPRGTPRDLVRRINRDIVAACSDPQTLTRFKGLGGPPTTTTPEEFATFTASERERWGRIIKSANIKLE